MQYLLLMPAVLWVEDTWFKQAPVFMDMAVLEDVIGEHRHLHQEHIMEGEAS